MNEPEKTKPLDLTTDEAADFLFPKEAIDAMKKVANPEKQRASDREDDCDESTYTQDSV